MNDILYDILFRYYGRLYGYNLCERMADHIRDEISDKGEVKWSWVRNYIWSNTSGGGVSIAAANEIHDRFPDVIRYDATGNEI